jgi:hypothetical protein
MILKLCFCVTGNPEQLQHASSAIITKSLNACHYLDLLKRIWMWIPLFSRNINFCCEVYQHFLTNNILMSLTTFENDNRLGVSSRYEATVCLLFSEFNNLYINDHNWIFNWYTTLFANQCLLHFIKENLYIFSYFNRALLRNNTLSVLLMST